MRFFEKATDGGKDSGVTGYYLFESKAVFSIVLLHFANGTRDAFHSHAFNALTLWLRGKLLEHDVNEGPPKTYTAGMLKYTPRSCFHKVESIGSSWGLSIRGPWVDRWKEKRGDRFVTLTHGRMEVSS